MIVADSIEIKRYTEGGTAAALGSFDALHRGHTEIIKRAVEDAKRRGVRSLVQFFPYQCISFISGFCFASTAPIGHNSPQQ